jgi:hypothetical protein
VLWLLTNTRDNERSPLYMTRVLARWHRANARLRLVFARHGPRVGLFIEAPAELQPLIEKQLAGEYKDVDVLRQPGGRLELAPSRQVWYRDLFLRPHVFPIERFTEQQEGSTRAYSDPLPGVLEAIASDEGIDARVELILRPATGRETLRLKKVVHTLARPYFRDHPRRSHRYALWATHHSPFVRTIANAWSLRAGWGLLPRETTDLAVSTSHAHEREHELHAAMDKVSSYLFAVTIRLSVAAELPNRAAALRKIDELAAVVSSTAIPRLARFHSTPVRRPHSASRRAAVTFLSAEEIASLWHPATAGVAAAGLRASEVRKPEPPDGLPDPREAGVTQLGKMLFRDRVERFGIRQVDARRHIYITGRTASGKTTCMRTMLESDIRQGTGVALLDPEGDLFATLRGSISRAHADRVILFDPADREYPIAYNPLAIPDGRLPEQVAGSVLAVFKHLYRDSWGPRMESIFRNALLATVELPEPSLVAAFQLLTDSSYRERQVRHVVNPLVRAYWQHEYPALNERWRQEIVEPVLNKLRSFLSDPTLVRILGQPDGKLNLRRVMDESKILLVNLSEGILGPDTSRLLGCLLTNTLQQAAMSRADVPEEQRAEFRIYIDEAQAFASPAFAALLSRGRKYHCSLVLNHQFQAQLDEETRAAIFGNCGTCIVFAVGAQDSELLTQHLGDGITASDLAHLPKYHAYCSLMIDGKSHDPFLMQTVLSPPAMLAPWRVHTIVERSRARYARPARTVDAQIKSQLDSRKANRALKIPALV